MNVQLTNYNEFKKDFFEHGIEYAAERSARLGFDAVEFLDICPAESCIPERINASDIRRVCGQNGLKISCYSVGADLLANDRFQLEKQLWRHIAFAAEIGSPYFHHTLVRSLMPDSRVPSYEAIFDSIVETAVQIANRCKTYGLTCLYEPQGLYFNGVDRLKHFFECVRQECSNVAICGDVGNSLFVDTSANDIYDAFIDSIRHVHLKDFQVSDQPFENGVCFRSINGKYLRECQLGQGVVDLGYCFQKLKEQKYQGAISFEFDGDDSVLSAAIQLVRNLMLQWK